ncbi:guanylate kinase-associated protein mars-like isoform X2 [Drosophila novamexicana]|uniref:guanylate kinase-associated protein mars-like isoform X2 n=2 Tax=Drosophila novamexicana TaxID=47314 RepID=UPI0011E58AEC|nr:guanylate kinase-associated protein mars-like isoform X2 [Drosophila novamexicana]
MQSRVLSPHNHIEINRERQSVVQTNLSGGLYQTNRIKDISPTSSKTLKENELQLNSLPTTAAQNEQENVLPANRTSVNKITKRQGHYLQRFLGWKEWKEAERQKKKKEEKEAQTDLNAEVDAQKKRRSLYVLDSKPEMTAPISLQLPAAKKPLDFAPMPTATKPPITSTSAGTSKTVASAVKLLATDRNARIKPQTAVPNGSAKPPLTASDNQAGNLKQTAKSLQAATEPIIKKAQKGVDPKQKPPTTLGVKKMMVGSVKNASRSPKLTTIRNRARGGAAQCKATDKNSLSSQLSQRMKSKKPAFLNCKQKQAILTKPNLLQETCDLQTPNTSLHVVSNKHLFKAMATSTERKSNKNSDNLLETYGDITNISPVAVGDRSNGIVSVAKRQLLASSPTLKESAVEDMRKLTKTPTRTDKHQKRRSMNDVESKAEMPVCNSTKNKKLPDIPKVTTGPISMQMPAAKKTLDNAATSAVKSKAKHIPFQVATTKKPSSFVASTAGVKSKPAAKSVKPFTIGRNLQNVEMKQQSRSQQASTEPMIKKTQIEAEPKRQPPTTLAAKQNMVGSAKNAPRPQNLMTQPFELPATSRNRGGGGAAQCKTKSKNSISSQLSTRMKSKKPALLNCKQRQAIFTKLNLLQANCDLQSPDTSLYIVSNKHLLKAAATSTECNSNKNSDNLLKTHGKTTNISPVAVSNESKETVSVAERLLTGSPTLKDSQQTLPAVEADVTMLAKSPIRTQPRQSIYLSPFVTVSRGKESTRMQRDNSNNTLIQSPSEKKPETPVALRSTLSSVQYFRMQLDNEIRRLHSLCAEWHLYNNQNEARLLENGAKDMIDAAIGQTKLLTSKKLMQFKSLIDRCEAGATGIGLPPNDGSEASKPVFVEDLEGWWDMLRLQSENVDKRFDRLLHLKANDWQDPDAEAVPKTKSKVGLKTKRKQTAKPSSELKSFLRKAYAAKRINQVSGEISEKSSQPNVTPKRQSQHRFIVVRDRKSFSPARTVLRVSRDTDNRPSIGGNSLLKSAIMGAAEQVSRQQLTPRSEQPMSILKTPGTKKREPGAHGVIFSAKKKVRRFQFTFDEGNISGEEVVIGNKTEDCEEDMTPERPSLQNGQLENSVNAATEEGDGNASRAYSLRNRIIRLRPSSEFM